MVSLVSTAHVAALLSKVVEKFTRFNLLYNFSEESWNEHYGGKKANLIVALPSSVHSPAENKRITKNVENTMDMSKNSYYY